MIDYKEFEKKVKSMSAHDIIMAMVEGLRNPRTKIDMNTYGAIREGVCFGCAATNAILHIMNANEEEVKSHVAHTIIYSDSPIYCDSTLYEFEDAINLLRIGEVGLYNERAYVHGFPQIEPIPGQELPALGDDYTEEGLKEYVKLAEYNKIKEA